MVRLPAARYDPGVAGLDEAHARSALAEMQERLARGPIAALGIAASATAEDARTAFLQLTKQYHPVRFGRMATDIQKLANEVFLSLRAAHDAFARTLRRPSGTLTTPSLPPVAATPAPASIPPAIPTINGRTGQSLPARTTRPAGSQDSAERPASPPRGTPIAVAARPTASRAVVASPASRPPSTARLPGSAPAPPRDEAAVLDLLQRQQWDQARSALHQLSARDPNSKRIRALVCYARGREAQLDRRVDDARVELQDALELDPDLQVAKTALTELFTRRK
jgi:tetratricopeptide (TPR) repeat protein